MRPSAARGTSASKHDRGFIVVAVLWIITALATLVSVYAVYVINTAYEVGASDDRVRAEALFTAALELTAYQLTSVQKQDRPPNGQASFRMGRATLVLQWHSEAARIDLNMASKEFLAGLFVVLGTQPADADQYADRVVAWRTRAGDENAQVDSNAQAEADAYRLAGRNYKPRRAPFQDVGELTLVLGLPPVLVERALPYVTVFSGLPQINILDASPIVIAALPGMAAAQMNAVLAARRSTAGGQAALEALGPEGGGATLGVSKAVRISASVQFDSGQRTGAEIVILVNDDLDEPYRVLSWRDDFDQIAPAAR
jgi:general secretion pathway protein K